MDQRTRKSPARFLAPLALIAVVVAFLAIVNSSPTRSTSSTSATSSTTSVATTTTKKAAAKPRAKKPTAKRFYTVQTGDTLGGIASKTGVPLVTIQSLNPNVDPTSMTTGQKIRLK